MEVRGRSSPSPQMKNPMIEISEKVKSGEYNLIDKLGRSIIWQHYKLVLGADGKELTNCVFCVKCERALKNVSISNLRKHKCFLAKIRSAEKPYLMNEDENSITEASEISEIIDNELSKLLRRWIIGECRSYDLIENEGLKTIFQEIARLGSKLDGGIDNIKLLPSPADISEKLSDLYGQCLEAIKSEIALIKDVGFSLSADLCTDKATEQDYIAIHIHYLKNGVLIMRLLGLQHLKGELHADQNVIDKLKQILENFECKLSSQTILVANKNNIHIENKTDVQNISCISQLLSNAMNESVQDVNEVEEIISAGSYLINFLIKKGQEIVLGEFPNKCYNNRWLATYNMLNTLENNWLQIEPILENINENGKITNLNRQHMKAVIQVFQPLVEAIETLEDSSSATMHLVIVFLHELKKSFAKADHDGHQFKFIEKLKAHIRCHLERIAAEDISILHKIALFLYPPTNQLLPFNATEKQHIENECIRLMQSYQQGSTSSTLKPDHELAAVMPAPKRKKLFQDFVSFESEHDPKKQLNQEIQFYKNTFVLNSEDFNVFNWWQLHKENFPFLYKLGCVVLSTPATCSASKQIFCASSNLFSAKRMHSARISQIEKIMFLNSNAELSYLAD